MERVPTARWDLLRARNAMTLMFLGHKNEAFFRWSLRLAFSTRSNDLTVENLRSARRVDLILGH